jgi:hypothetical protein
MEIFEHFNSRINKASPITIAYCVLHNYCEMWGAPKFKLANARIRGDNLMGFGVNKLLIVREVEQAKVEGERLKKALFEQWVINHPILP